MNTIQKRCSLHDKPRRAMHFARWTRGFNWPLKTVRPPVGDPCQRGSPKDIVAGNGVAGFLQGARLELLSGAVLGSERGTPHANWMARARRGPI